VAVALPMFFSLVAVIIGGSNLMVHRRSIQNAADAAALAPLGVRMSLPNPAGERLLERYKQTTARVRQIYLAVLDRLAE